MHLARPSDGGFSVPVLTDLHVRCAPVLETTPAGSRQRISKRSLRPGVEPPRQGFGKTGRDRPLPMVSVSFPPSLTIAFGRWGCAALPAAHPLLFAAGPMP